MTDRLPGELIRTSGVSPYVCLSLSIMVVSGLTHTDNPWFRGDIGVSLMWRLGRGIPDHEGGTAGGASVAVLLPADGTGGMKRGRYVWILLQSGAPSHREAVI